MKSLSIFCALLLAAKATYAINIPVLGSIDLVKDSQQYQACEAADPKTTFAGIRYGDDGPPEVVHYSQCVLWRKNDEIIANAVFCRPATCFVFSDTDCLTPSLPAPVIVPISIDFLNAADFVELLGQSAFCGPNTLPV